MFKNSGTVPALSVQGLREFKTLVISYDGYWLLWDLYTGVGIAMLKFAAILKRKCYENYQKR
jgi:hypothetical protein